MDFNRILTRRAGRLAPSPIRTLVPLMRLPGMISFGGGYPHPGTFAMTGFCQTFKNGKQSCVNQDQIINATQYGPSDCLPDLSEFLCKWHAYKDQVQLKKNQIVVLNGSQEGLHMMAYLFLEENDWVAISEPAYPGALGAFNAFSPNFLTFPIDDQGSRVDLLEQKLGEHVKLGNPLPKFIYEVPNGHNPGGVGLSLERRKALIDLANRLDLLVLEDDPYELLQLEQRAPLPTLQSLDTQSRVIRLDSFSKIFAPGLRIGYASGPAEIIEKFLFYKQGMNLHTSSLSQKALAGFFDEHSFDEFLAMIRENCAFYRTNRDAMIKAVKKHLNPEIEYNIPMEGMFLWLRGPEDLDIASRIEKSGRELGVLVVPGTAFSPEGGLKNCMRASFSMVAQKDIEEGIGRLAKMLRT